MFFFHLYMSWGKSVSSLEDNIYGKNTIKSQTLMLFRYKLVASSTYYMEVII